MGSRDHRSLRTLYPRWRRIHGLETWTSSLLVEVGPETLQDRLVKELRLAA